MKNQELVRFLSSRETPPKEVHYLVKKDIQLSFHKKIILSKFIFFQLLGALFSLSVCPQFGLGLPEGHGITHSFRLMGDWACALFCGIVFLSSGAFVAYMGMKGEELWWIWQRYKSPLLVLPAFLWGALMLTNISLQLPGETLSYHLIWLLTAVLTQALWFQLRSGLYVRQVAI